MQDKQRIFVIGVDMDNQSAEDIARDASLQIVKITDALIAKQNQERVNTLQQEDEKGDSRDDSNII